jgi:hypothetical protein
MRSGAAVVIVDLPNPPWPSRPVRIHPARHLRSTGRYAVNSTMLFGAAPVAGSGAIQIHFG